MVSIKICNQCMKKQMVSSTYSDWYNSKENAVDCHFWDERVTEKMD